jgi:CRISPR/Cas system-associated protein Csm6
MAPATLPKPEEDTMKLPTTAEVSTSIRNRLDDYEAQRMAADLRDACADLGSLDDCVMALHRRGYAPREIDRLIDRAIEIASAELAATFD